MNIAFFDSLIFYNILGISSIATMQLFLLNNFVKFILDVEGDIFIINIPQFLNFNSDVECDKFIINIPLFIFKLYFRYWIVIM